MAHSNAGTRHATDSVAEFIESALIAIVLVFLIIRPFIVQAFYIPSESMVPTLQKGDRILVNKFIYHFTQPRRGDVVVFRAPHEVSYDEKDFIKRVVAIPGDVIQAVPERILADDRVVLSFADGYHSRPEFFVPGNRVKSLSPPGVVNSKLEVLDGHVIVSMSGSPDQEIYLGDPSAVRAVEDRVYLGDRMILQLDPPDRPVVTMGLAAYNGDPTLDAAVITVGGELRAVVVRGRRLIIDHGHVIRNGEELREKTVKEPPNYDMPPITVPPGEYFVMGDNRNDSNDSHAWINKKTLEGDRIIGRAEAIFWPLYRIRLIR
ncbi:MAG: signal peptidase I [Armatimonadetes bacterium]|nr:signal peptidase I [Armatimonadota bacterium]